MSYVAHLVLVLTLCTVYIQSLSPNEDQSGSLDPQSPVAIQDSVNVLEDAKDLSSNFKEEEIIGYPIEAEKRGDEGTGDGIISAVKKGGGGGKKYGGGKKKSGKKGGCGGKGGYAKKGGYEEKGKEEVVGKKGGSLKKGGYGYEPSEEGY